jgi:hypothetical protein
MGWEPSIPKRYMGALVACNNGCSTGHKNLADVEGINFSAYNDLMFLNLQIVIQLKWMKMDVVLLIVLT